ncbi:hypothetical protein CQA86_32310, partial [Klebsiella pneumoniae]
GHREQRRRTRWLALGGAVKPLPIKRSRSTRVMDYGGRCSAPVTKYAVEVMATANSEGEPGGWPWAAR